MGLLQDLKDKVMGTKEQNEAASKRMKAEDAKSPDTVQAKVNKVVGYKKGGKINLKDCRVSTSPKGNKNSGW